MESYAEIDAFLIAVHEASELAHRGRAAEGYECLLLARKRAEGASESGEPWDEVSDLLWQRALETFAERHGVGRA